MSEVAVAHEEDGGRHRVAEEEPHRTHRRGGAQPPRLLIKDPCLAERILEMAFVSVDGTVQCHLYAEGGRSGHDRFRVRGSAAVCGIQGAAAPAAGGAQLVPSSP